MGGPRQKQNEGKILFETMMEMEAFEPASSGPAVFLGWGEDHFGFKDTFFEAAFQAGCTS